MSELRSMYEAIKQHVVSNTTNRALETGNIVVKSVTLSADAGGTIQLSASLRYHETEIRYE